MIAIAVILAIILILAMLRFGVAAEYSDEGMTLAITAGFLKIRVLPPGKKKKEKKKKEKRRKKEEKPEEKKPGKLGDYLKLVSSAKNMLSRLRRRLLIKRLIIHFVSASEDPSKTALTFGAANAAVGLVVPFLEKSFRIRHRDFRLDYDFGAAEHRIYINAAVSIAIWEALYVVFAILPAILAMTKKGKSKTLRKEDNKDGKASDKRIDGDDNAKSEGDDRRQYDRGRADNNG